MDKEVEIKEDVKPIAVEPVKEVSGANLIKKVDDTQEIKEISLVSRVPNQ